MSIPRNVAPRSNIKEKSLQSFVKQVLQSRLFIGNFRETRLVDSLNCYRNVVVVNNDESELIRDLDVVKNYARKVYGEDYWIGITKDDNNAPSGCCLWVELLDEIFGSYWYKISKIKFRSNEMLLCLRAVKPINNSSDSINPLATSYIETSKDSQVVNLNASKETIKIKLVNALFYLSDILTIKNILEFIKFTLLLVFTLLTGLFTFFENFGEFALKLLREFSNLICVSTPVLLGCLDLIAKIFGGFYLLILGMWRDWNTPSKPNYNQPKLTYNRQTHQAINY